MNKSRSSNIVSSVPFDNVWYLCMLWYLSVLNLEAGDKQVYMIYQASSSNGARLCLLFRLNYVETVNFIGERFISTSS